MGKKVVTFAIDNENGITAYPSRKEAEAAFQCGYVFSGDGSFFASREQLDQVLTGCPGSRLIEIWNGIPGVEPVSKFTSRTIAIGRIWKAIQPLAPAVAEETADVAPQAADVAPKSPKPTRKATAPKKRRTAPPQAEHGESKKAQVLAMLQQPGGVTLAAIMKATGWLSHTTRAFVATVPKKLGIEVVSAKVDGERTYSAAAATTSAGA
jgi:hypothetical protein